MHTYTLATKAAPNKQGARIDALLRNERNQGLWSDWKKLRAEVIKLELMLIYRAKGFYVSYGKLGISVKVDGIHSIADRPRLRTMEGLWLEEGVIRKFTEQGVIYRFK